MLSAGEREQYEDGNELVPDANEDEREEEADNERRARGEAGEDGSDSSIALSYLLLERFDFLFFLSSSFPSSTPSSLSSSSSFSLSNKYFTTGAANLIAINSSSFFILAISCNCWVVGFGGG